MAAGTQTSDASRGDTGAEPLVHILWMKEGLGCDGDSVALPRAPARLVPVRPGGGSHRAGAAGPGAAGATASPTGESAAGRRRLRLLTWASMTAIPSAPAGGRVTMAGSW